MVLIATHFLCVRYFSVADVVRLRSLDSQSLPVGGGRCKKDSAALESRRNSPHVLGWFEPMEALGSLEWFVSVAGESFSRGHVHAMPSGGSQVSVADFVRSVQHRLGPQAVWVLEDFRSSAGGFDAQGVSTTCKPSEEEKRAHHSGDVGSVDLQVER